MISAILISVLLVAACIAVFVAAALWAAWHQ